MRKCAYDFDVTGIDGSQGTISKKVRSEPGSDRFGHILNIANPDPDLRFGSAISLNFDPNLGPVQTGSGSTLGSEPDRGITSQVERSIQAGELFL